MRLRSAGGVTVAVKLCPECGVEKIVDRDRRRSAFYVFERGAKGVTFSRFCRECTSARAKRRRDADPDYAEKSRVYHQRSVQRVKDDPELRAVQNERRASRDRRLRRSLTGEERERYLSRRRDAQRAWRAKHPDYYTVAAKRARAAARSRPTGRALATVEPGPFRVWLYAYAVRRRELWLQYEDRWTVSLEAVADELGLIGRSVRRLMDGGPDRVAFDRVDAALARSVFSPVTVDGVDVWTALDLYPSFVTN